MRAPLTSRPLDLLYFFFFLTHVPASALVDFQLVYPAEYVPTALRGFLKGYVQRTSDPFMGTVVGLGDPAPFLWFKTFVCLELFFQLPVFILGMRGLWKDSHSIYLLLLIYGASTATTTLPCITTILYASSVTSEQRGLLLACYAPYLLIPLLMTVDMAGRVKNLISTGSGTGTGAGAGQEIKRD